MLPRRFPSRFSATVGGFTLVEILIVCLITIGFVLGLWQLFGKAFQEMHYGTWYSTSIGEMRTGLRRLREDIGRANYPSVITPGEAKLLPDAEHNLKYHNGTLNLRTNPGANTGILEFYMCKPKRDKFNDGTDVGDEHVKCRLEARGRELWYIRTAAAGSPPPQDLGTKRIIADVEEVTVSINPIPAAVGDLKTLVEMTVKTTMPNNKEKTAAEKTNAKIAVDTVAF